jgi:methyl-accepting chemotaxis protein
MKFNIMTKLIASFLVINAIMVGMGIFGLSRMKAMYEKTVYVGTNLMPSVDAIKTIHLTASNYRRQQIQHVIATSQADKAEYETKMEGFAQQIDAQFKNYEQMITDDQDGQYLQTLSAAWLAYRQTTAPVMENSRQANTTAALELLNGEGRDLFTQMNDGLEQWAGYQDQLASQYLQNASGDYNETSTMFIVLLVVAAVFALGLSYAQAHTFSRAARLMADTAGQIAQVDLVDLVDEIKALSNGDLTRSVDIRTQVLAYKSGDELGLLANRFNDMILRLHETGLAFADMTHRLKGMIGNVNDNAARLNVASNQLSTAATQSGRASAQIASTIQQVSQGINQQSASVSLTAASVEQMSRAIQGVALGAQDQSAAVARASSFTSQIFTAIEQISASAQAQAASAARSVNTTQTSAKTVEDTILGMKTIKIKVDLSAQRMQEMGQKSEQIGMIVDTIDDIASQTNLLALNAAIEAARAGEHGKGFAVVADEVRKLAEKSASATKEITNLILSIQSTVQDAVQAMNESAGEVEKGVELANQSGSALFDILETARNSKLTGEEIAAAARQMISVANELVSAVDSVSAVVEENTAATEQMSASSNEVSHAVENIASVSEENSAAVEEISAGAEEMSAQVEEVTASAQSLAEMAYALQTIVEQFKLDEDLHPAPGHSRPEGSPGEPLEQAAVLLPG